MSEEQLGCCYRFPLRHVEMLTRIEAIEYKDNWTNSRDI